MTQKFKVGDKVKLINMGGAVASGAKLGSELTITELLPEERYKVGYISVNSGRYVPNGKVFARNIELLPLKLQKKERISALEAQVAELTAKVEALEKASKPKYTLNELLAPLPKSTNEQRKAIIAEAKAFVADNKKDFYGERLYKIGVYMCEADFYVNKKKRVVTCVVKHISNGVIAKAIAKCAPDDVFNADIGKAIALGRALGLDVMRFEQAVKPSELVVGHVITKVNGPIGHGRICKVVDGKAFNDGPGTYWSTNIANNTTLIGIDDTDAQY